MKKTINNVVYEQYLGEGIETLVEGKVNCVFVIPFFKGKIYENYDEVEREVRETEILSIMPLMRAWQGSIGFAGGKVEKGETAHEAVLREASEEISFDLSGLDLQPLCRHESEKANIIAYSLDVENLELAGSIISRVPQAQHFGTETGGLFVLQIQKFVKKNLDTMLWAATAGEEAKILLGKLGEDL